MKPVFLMQWLHSSPDELKKVWGIESYKEAVSKLNEVSATLDRPASIYDDWEQSHLDYLKEKHPYSCVVLMSLLFHSGGEKWVNRIIQSLANGTSIGIKRREEMTIAEQVKKVNYCIANPSRFKVIIHDFILLERYDLIRSVASPIPDEQRWEVKQMGTLKPHEMKFLLDNHLLILPVGAPFAWWEIEATINEGNYEQNLC